jgi:hypothetical protein
VTLGLYNTYDRTRFREAHRRALARAAPLCLSYDYNLAAFGFPFPEDIRKAWELAEYVADSTTIGEGGEYFRSLSAKGRFQAFPFPRGGFPPQLGIPVATTCRPEPKKAVDVVELASLVLSGKSVLLVFGLGRKGLPEDVRNTARHHLDVSSGGHSFETCAAMGAVAASLWHLMRVLVGGALP